MVKVLPYSVYHCHDVHILRECQPDHFSEPTMLRGHAGKYHARVLPCPFKCGQFCKSASGLTQHRNACARNPAYRRASTRTPPPPTTPPPCQPSVSPRSHGHGTCHSRTSTSRSPRQHRQTVNRRSLKSRIHPFLDGAYGILCITGSLLMLNFS
jgi:hypothetical protein